MKRIIISHASTLSGDSQTDSQTASSPQVTTPKLVWGFFEQQVADSTSRRSPSISALTEIEQYFKLPFIPRKEDPLQWWKHNGHVFPSLQLVAQVYLSTVATSVPSERLFSKAGELISAKRNRIKAKHVNMFLFLNQQIC